MLDDDGEITGLEGVSVKGEFSVPAQSIAFVAVSDASNAACR
jgi:hypothetical protein